MSLNSRERRVWQVNDREADESHSSRRIQYRGTGDIQVDSIQEPRWFGTISGSRHGKVASWAGQTREQSIRRSHPRLPCRCRSLFHPQHRRRGCNRLTLPRPYHRHMHGAIQRVLHHGFSALVRTQDQLVSTRSALDIQIEANIHLFLIFWSFMKRIASSVKSDVWDHRNTHQVSRMCWERAQRRLAFQRHGSTWASSAFSAYFHTMDEPPHFTLIRDLFANTAYILFYSVACLTSADRDQKEKSGSIASRLSHPLSFAWRWVNTIKYFWRSLAR